MLKVNVGLSRKLSKDYNSTGYSINLEGEITAPVSDAEAVVEQVKELYDLAEEALAVQVDRSQGVDAIASRDEEPKQTSPVGRNGNGYQRSTRAAQRPSSSSENGNGNGNGNNGNGNGNGKSQDPATNKQIQYLLSIGKRQRLTTVQLEKEIAEIIGRPVGVYDLSKSDAAVVIDTLANAAKAR